MNDSISRQAAIDAAIEAVDSWDGGCNIGRQKRIENYIKQLPSVQPEIVRCKDCKYHYKGICPIEKYFSLDGFCSRGER